MFRDAEAAFDRWLLMIGALVKSGRKASFLNHDDDGDYGGDDDGDGDGDGDGPSPGDGASHSNSSISL